jgi:CRISPR-associated protein Csd2
VSDVCLKRKIRDRLQESGQDIFVQSDEKKTDGMTSLKNRAEADEPIGLGKDTFASKKTDKDLAAKKACEKWFDVRAFGQVFAFGKSDDAAGVSIAIRGPVTMQSAFSVEPVNVISTQITKSVNSEDRKDGKDGKNSDTMGMKHRIDKAIYVTYGAMNPQLAERTGFSDEDAEAIKAILPKLFEGDASSARPEGSMKVEKVIWWKHNSKPGQYSSAKVHGSLSSIINQDGSYDSEKLKNHFDDLKPEERSGF